MKAEGRRLILVHLLLLVLLYEIMFVPNQRTTVRDYDALLVGIAVNNSIILVDRINQLKQSGMELTDAIVESGQQRIRPILMTTLTTILALLPMTFGFGEGASLRSPMAIAVIGGLVTSTVMSLVVIPCVYYVFEKMKRGR